MVFFIFLCIWREPYFEGILIIALIFTACAFFTHIFFQNTSEASYEMDGVLPSYPRPRLYGPDIFRRFAASIAAYVLPSPQQSGGRQIVK